jgi:hypothetical protein
MLCGGCFAQGKDSPPPWGVEGFALVIDMGPALGWCVRGKSMGSQGRANGL